MNFKINLQFLLLAAFGVTGIIQWIKGIIKDPKNPWSYVSPVLCIGMGILMNGGIRDVVMNSVLILSVSQLGYDVLVKPVKRLLGISELPPGPTNPNTSAGTDADINKFLKETDKTSAIQPPNEPRLGL